MQITDNELKLFQYIYDYKTLTLPQCWRVAYKDLYPNDYASCVKEKIYMLIQDGFLEYVSESFCKYRVVLTAKGIHALRESKNIPKTIVNYRGIEARNYKRPSELRLREGLAPHQLSLNDFLLYFEEYVQGLPVTYSIDAEHSFKNYDYFRPDAMIRIEREDGRIMHICVEQDMGTESSRQLFDKWLRYRKFIATNGHSEDVGKIVMVFLINYDTSGPAPHGMNFNKMEQVIDFREKEVFKTITHLYPALLDGSFDAYIGTEAEILEAVQKQIMPEFLESPPFEKKFLIPVFKKELGYTVSRGGIIAPVVSDIAFSYYMRKVKEDKILKNNEEVPLSFLCDDATCLPLSVIAKMSYVDQINMVFRAKQPKHPGIKYIVFTEQKEKLMTWITYSQETIGKRCRIVSINQFNNDEPFFHEKK